MVSIRAGTVTIDGDTHHLDSFWLDAHEVTIGQYARFLDEVGVGLTPYDHTDQPAAKTSHTPKDWEILLAKAKKGALYRDQPIDLNCPVFLVDWWGRLCLCLLAWTKAPVLDGVDKSGKRRKRKPLPMGVIRLPPDKRIWEVIIGRMHKVEKTTALITGHLSMTSPEISATLARLVWLEMSKNGPAPGSIILIIRIKRHPLSAEPVLPVLQLETFHRLNEQTRQRKLF